MNNCYNKEKELYRVWKCSKSEPWIRIKHFVWEPTFRNIEKGTIDNDEYNFSVYPYRFYLLRLIYWNTINLIVNLIKRIVPIAASELIIICVKWIFNTAVIIGLAYLYYRLGWNH